MRLLGRKHLRAAAEVFSGGNTPLVKLVIGHAIFVMDTDEATDLAHQLVAAADCAKAQGRPR